MSTIVQNRVKKVFIFSKKIKFTSYVSYCSKWSQKSIYFFAKIKLISYVNYLFKKQPSMHCYTTLLRVKKLQLFRIRIRIRF